MRLGLEVDALPGGHLMALAQSAAWRMICSASERIAPSDRGLSPCNGIEHWAGFRRRDRKVGTWNDPARLTWLDPSAPIPGGMQCRP